MSPRLWVGEREAAGKVAVYRGPILLAYDPRFDDYDPTHLPTIDVTRAPAGIVYAGGERHSVNLPLHPGGLLRIQFVTTDGKRIWLCDFASAGAGGNPYVSWLPAAGMSPSPFTRDNPLRAVWPPAPSASK